MTLVEFRARLHELHALRQSELKDKFDRSLPFADAEFDRWERARRLGFAEGASIYESAAVFGSVTVGTNTWVGPGVLLDGSGGGISIGAFCTIGASVHIFTHDTMLWALSGGRLGRHARRVQVGDCVYIGAQSVVAAGVTIGTQSVIAANSFVNKCVAPRTVVGGSPARRLGRVEGEGEQVKVVFEQDRPA